MVCFDTRASTTAERRKPSASGQSTCQNIAKARLSALPVSWRMNTVQLERRGRVSMQERSSASMPWIVPDAEPLGA